MTTRYFRTLVAVRLVLAAAVAASLSTASAADAERHAEVARRGAEVMPFELAKIRHVFTKTPNGGTQRLVVKNSLDAKQVLLVREHLHEIEAQFERRDFNAPARIHGKAMPGLAELEAAPAGTISIRYADVKGGAMLTFTTVDAHLVHALHRWFDAQVDDHGRDATAGHVGHAVHLGDRR